MFAWQHNLLLVACRIAIIAFRNRVRTNITALPRLCYINKYEQYTNWRFCFSYLCLNVRGVRDCQCQYHRHMICSGLRLCSRIVRIYIYAQNRTLDERATPFDALYRRRNLFADVSMFATTHPNDWYTFGGRRSVWWPPSDAPFFSTAYTTASL